MAADKAEQLRAVTARRSHGSAITRLPLLLVIGGCAVSDDPQRTFSLPNDTGSPRLVARCSTAEDCRSVDEGELVAPGASFQFKVYFDESRTYVVGDTQGRTLGCASVHVADGTGGYPESLSDLTPCPAGTAAATRRRA